MNEVEYVLRVILRARDEMAKVFTTAAVQLGRFRQQIRGADKDMNDLNSKVTSLTKRLGNLNDRLDAAGQAFKRFASTKKDADKDIERNVNLFERLAGAAGLLGRGMKDTERSTRNMGRGARDAGRDTDRLGDSFRRGSSSASGMGTSIAQLDNNLRGMGLLLVFGFAQQLITGLVALGGELVAVAGSAAMAGGAFAGGLTAGILQAIPAVSLLIGAMTRVKATMDAVDAAQKLQQANFVQGEKSGRAVADATDSIANAHDSVRDAMERVADQTERLTDVRDKARRNLEDLTLAEKQADLAARGAALSQKDAQEALRKAIIEGGDVQRARLDVEEAGLNRVQANRTQRRARQDVRAVGGNIENMDDVKQAERALEDAKQAADRAARGLDSAKRNAEEAVAGTQTAAANLNYLLSQLSPAEKRLYESIKRIQDTWKNAYRPITDIIIDSFVRVVDRVDKIIQMPAVLRTATRLARTIAGQINRITDAFSSAPIIAQFLRISEAGRKNLEPLTGIAIRIGTALLNIGEAAGPALSKFIGYVGELVDQFGGLTDDGDKLEDFFNSGEKHLEAWLNLAVSVIKLFAALTGAGGADTGLRSINDATKAIDGLTDKVNDNRDKVAGFFEDARKATYEIIRVVVAVGEEIAKSFDPSHFKNLADIMTSVVIPAFGIVIRTVGQFTDIIATLMDVPVIRDLAKWGIVLAAFAYSSTAAANAVTQIGSRIKFLGGQVKAVQGGIATAGRSIQGFGDRLKLQGKLGEMEGASSKLTGTLGKLGGAFAGVGAAIQSATAVAFGPWGLAIAAAVLAVGLLLHHFGRLDDVWQGIKDAGKIFMDAIQPAVESLKDALGDLGINVDKMGGAMGVLNKIGQLLADLISGYLIESFKTLALVLSGVAIIIIRAFTGIIKIVKGVVDVIVGLFTLDFDQVSRGMEGLVTGIITIFGGIVEGVIQVVKGIVNAIVAPFRRAVEAVKDFLGIKSPSRVFRNIGDAIVDGLKAGVRALVSVITAPFRAAWRAIRGVFDNAKDLGKWIVDKVVDGVRAYGRLWQSVGTWMRDRLSDAIHNVGSGLESIGKRIIDALIRGIKASPKAIADAIDWLLDKVPGGGAIKGALGAAGSVAGKVFAKGGPVPGTGSTDSVKAWLTPGEHVITKDEVRAAGGHGVIFALRALLGGGRQAQGNAFAEGGAVGGGGGLTISFEGGNLDDFKSTWKKFWSDLVDAARGGTGDIEEQFRDMRVNTSRSADRMYRDVRSSIADIEHSFDVRGGNMSDKWQGTWQALAQLAYDGLFYIAHEANRALHGFGAKTVNFGLSAPDIQGKAGGGWIGQKGQRGRDMGLYALGAGEAVLNWAHQKVVEPAMNAYYGFGLDQMFGRTRAFHAEPTGRPGLAEGGRAGETRLQRLIAAANKVDAANFPYVWGGGHTQPAHFTPFDCSGAVSYVVQQAGYKVPTSTSGNMGSWGFPKGPDGATVFFNPGHTFMKIGSRYFGTSGFARPNGGAGWFNKTPSPGYLAGFDRIHLPGIDKVGKFLAGVGGEIARLMVKGPKSIFKTMMQKMFDTSVDAANSFVGQQESELGAGNGQWGDFAGDSADINVGKTLIKIWRGMKLPFKALLSAFETGIVESGMRNLPGGDADSAGWRQERASLYSNPTSVNASGRRFFQEWLGFNDPGETAGEVAAQVQRPAAQYRGRYQAARAAALALLAKMGVDIPAGMAFAKGGIVPGGAGAPVGIVAHAGEWILNKIQQSKLAQLLGMGVGKLKGALGFGGGPTQFAEGGEVTLQGPLGSVRSIVDPKLERLFQKLKDLTDKLAGSTGLGSVTAFTRDLDSVLDGLRDASARMRRVKSKSDRDKGVDKFLDVVENLTGETGLFGRLRAAIERRANAAARSLITGRFSVGAGRQVTERMGAVDLAESALEEQRRQRGDLLGERDAINRQLRQVVNRQRKGGLTPEQMQRLQAQENTLRGMLDDAKDRVADNIQSIFEAQQAFTQAQVDAQQAQVDAVNSRYEAAATIMGRMTRVATALGDTETIRKVNELTRASMGSQIEELTQKLHQARHLGYTEMAQTLTDQIEDLRVAITESLAQELKDTVDAINQSTSRRLGRLDLFGRLLDATGVVGQAGAVAIGGESFSRSGLFQQRNAALEAQRSGLQGALVSAQAQGNIGLIQDLTDQLAELDVTIKENTKAAFDAKVADLNSRSGYTLGINDLNKQIIELTGQISGNTDTVELTRLANERQATLEQKGRDLEALRAEAIANGNQQGVNDLTQAILENKVATLQNTISLDELSGKNKQAQTFSSSAWTLFREAIFSGMGNVLPRYQVPMAATGGIAMRAGMYHLEPGELYVPPQWGLDKTVNEGDTIVNLYGYERPVDTTEITSAIAFARKHDTD